MTVASQRGHYLDRPHPSGLAEVLDLILDKGLVIDIYLRVSLVGIELLTVDARIVVASVDTYLRFAEAVNRLDISAQKPEGLPELMNDLRQGGARHKTKGALEGVKESVSESVRRRLGGEDEQDEADEEPEEEPRRRPRPAARHGRERER